MRCAIVSDYGYEGGAAVAANRLCVALQRQSVEAVRFASLFLGPIQDTIGDWSVRPALPTRLAIKLSRKFSGQDCETTWLNRPRTGRLLARLREFKPDIISLHNIHGAGLQPSILRELFKISPVVWTLHDMWAITAGCTHAFGCTKFITGCDASCQCRFRMPTRVRQMAKRNWQLRRAVYQELHNRVVFITPSCWLAGVCKGGLLREGEVHVIPNGLDLADYYPLPREQARTALGFPTNARIVLFLAAWLSDELKGLRCLIEALNRLAARFPDIWLVTVGDGASSAQFSSLNVQHVHLGGISEARFMRLCYNAADVYALPSLAENLPNTLLEALACGTPCVAFDVGGVSEIIRPGETGFLAQPESSESLAHSLRQVLDLAPEAWQALSQRCRQVAEAAYHLDLYARRHIELFKGLLNAQ
jgi:glycosyltransferase involved in cell wall biosynthesis